jgi:hypothetical protein
MDNNIESELNLIESNEDRIMANVQSDMLGHMPTIFGKKLRPIKLASIALLQKTKNEIVSGKAIEDCDNLLLDSCKVVLLQSISLREAIKLADDPNELELQAYELADQIAPSEMPQFQQLVMDLLQSSQETRVEPVEETKARQELSVDMLGES